jgi:hypothetical protein
MSNINKIISAFLFWHREASALYVLIQDYKKQYLGVGVINATVAGGGFAARPVLQTAWRPGIRPILGEATLVGSCLPVR